MKSKIKKGEKKREKERRGGRREGVGDEELPDTVGQAHSC